MGPSGRVVVVTVPPSEFEEFYLRTKDRCLRALLVSRDEPDACEELLAEAYARAWSRWSSVSQHPAPEAWVIRTALNLRVSWWRRRQREQPADLVPAVATEDDLGSLHVVDLLRGLPERQRQVVALRVLLDLDTRQTAQALGIAEGTVTAHLARAMTSLRAHLSSAREETP